MQMNAVGIDVSKGKSTVAIMRQFGEVVASPFEVAHADSGLDELAAKIKGLHGETKVVMEYTGSYYQPVAYALHEAGLYVSAVHAKLTTTSATTASVRSKPTKPMPSKSQTTLSPTGWSSPGTYPRTTCGGC